MDQKDSTNKDFTRPKRNLEILCYISFSWKCYAEVKFENKWFFDLFLTCRGKRYSIENAFSICLLWTSDPIGGQLISKKSSKWIPLILLKTIFQGLSANGPEFKLNGKEIKILSGSLHYFRFFKYLKRYIYLVIYFLIF